MKTLLIATVASLALVTTATAQSSTTVTTGSGGTAVTTGTGTTTVTIEPEVRTKVKQYVTTSKPKAVTVPSGFTVSRGVALPETVEVEAFVADVGVREYRYAVVGGRTVLVNSRREIVEIID